MEWVAFFFNDTATTEIYTLSLHDALPIFLRQVLARHEHHALAAEQERHRAGVSHRAAVAGHRGADIGGGAVADRKSTRLNSSHANISYAVFCLKKKKFPPLLYLLLSIYLH